MSRAGNAARAALLALATIGAAACGDTSAKILERTPAGEPPGSNLRVDVFVVREATSCAIGDACASADPENCFYLANAAGPEITIEPSSLTFVAPDDPRLATAQRSGCFRVTIDDATVAAIDQQFRALRVDVFRLSGGEIDLDPRLHEVSIESGFRRWELETGLFLDPEAFDVVGAPLVNRDTDLVFAVSGTTDPETGSVPKVVHCAGTNWEAKGGFGGAAYTWLSTGCLSPETLLRHTLHQIYFGLRDVNAFADAYDGDYPACGSATRTPDSWFPNPDHCTTDPDAPACGAAICDDRDFAAHVLRAHWPRGRVFSGNHCRNAVQDHGETGVDTGGVCDRIGR